MRTEKQKKYHREWAKKWRLENPQKARNQYKKDGLLYAKRHPEKVKEQVANAVKKWRKKNPERNLAHRAVFIALRNGTLIRGICFCGESKVQAHHSDYSKPLEVEWLCKIHHVLADYKRKLNEK